MLAGGAWSRLFCGNAGIDLPQLKVLGSVFRTAPLERRAGDRRRAARCSRSASGWMAAIRSRGATPTSPTSRRTRSACCCDYLPTLKQNYGEIRLRFGRRFLEEWRTTRRWSLDEATPFEAVRVLDPAPRQAVLAEARSVLSRCFPAFARMQVAESWGGLIDVTPDAVPVIGEVAAIPGFFLATGFSGHGFGIGPGAGRLIADLVAGDTPVVDPAPFRSAASPRSLARPRKWRALPSPSDAAVSMAARQRALFAVLCFVWGTTWLAMKVGIAVVPPGVFAGTRWTTAGLMLLLWR